MQKLNITQFGSMSQAASASGIPISVLKAAKRNGCPAFVRDRVDIGEFIVWWFNREAGDDEDWSKRDKRASALTKEAKLEETLDHTCSVSSVTRFIQDLVGNHFFGELDRMKHEFPSTLKGKDEVAIFEEMEKQIESAKKTLRGILDQWERGEMRKHD